MANSTQSRSRGLLRWLPPSAAAYIYTVILKPKPLRALAQWVICKIIPAEILFREVRLVLNQRDAIVSGNLALGCYETGNLDVFENLLQPGQCVLDIGANIGLYSALACKRVGPTGRVIAVEPSAENCGFIRQTAERNGFAQLSVNQKAAGASRAEAFLYLCSNNKADHRVFDQSHQRDRVPVEILPLDDLLDGLQVTRVDVMKIDTQGYEAFVFDGMKRLLQDKRPLKIMMEFWPWGIEQSGRQPAELLQTIKAHGFTVTEIGDDGVSAAPLTDFTAILNLRLERQHTNLLLERS
jgi:FkbM family methyltransferase